MRNPKRVVVSEKAPPAQGPYSQAVQVGSWIYVSGQIAADPVSGSIAGGGVRQQTEAAIRNVGKVLAGAGLGFESIIKTTVFMTDLRAFDEMNEVYARFFTPPAPARTTVQVSALPRGALIEIEAVAYKVLEH